MKRNERKGLFSKASRLVAAVSVCALILSGCTSGGSVVTTGKTETANNTANNTTEETVKTMKIGVASACTNAPEDIDMSGFTLTGFGNINRRYLGVHDDIEMSCMAIEMNGKKAAVIAADTLGWDKDLTDALRERVEKELSIPKDALMFNASHTHSAFNTLTNTHGLGYPVKEYQDFFYETAFRVIKEAFEDLEDGELYQGTVTANYVAISRRAIINGVCYWQPSLKDPRSDKATVIKAVCGGKTKAVLFSFPCHPSTMNTNYLSADYVGEARKVIEKEFEGAKAIFVQGCGGDIKTRVVNDGMTAFRATTFDDIRIYGERLANAVVRLCKGENKNLVMKKIEGDLDAKVVRFEIPLQEHKTTKEEYQKLAKSASDVLVEVYTWFYENYDNLPTAIPYSVQRIDLGDEFSIFALEGEVVVEYDALVKALVPDRDLLVAGYSNGEIGYICVTRMYKEGGYEPERSCLYYGIPQGFVPEIETIILDHAKELCD